MTARGRNRRKRLPEDFEELQAHFESLLDQLSDETEDERRDFADPARDPFESEHGPVMGTDGDDNPHYAQPKGQITYRGRTVKVKGTKGKQLQVEVIEPGQIADPVDVKPRENPAGEIADAGHGFIVNNPRSRPWKTARRTHCAYCGGPMPKPDASKYRCELDPDASEIELSLIGRDNAADDRGPFARRSTEVFPGCQCSGCTLRNLIASGRERGRGNPPKYCSEDHGQQADNERRAWRRAVVRAQERGEEPPPEPEDRGLKFIPARGLRSSIEGSGHRYVTGSGNPRNVPRA